MSREKRMKKREQRESGKAAEKEDAEENLEEKLRRGALVGKRGGPATPVLSWTPHIHTLFNSVANHGDHHHLLPPVSARKLAAGLWEFLHYFPLSQMPSAPRHKDKGVRLKNFLDDASSSSPSRLESAIKLKRHIAASLMQNHQCEENNQDLQPVSPASYGSSLEVAPYRPAVTPTSSLDFKGRVGGSRYRLKTSTELLKILNRIWSLEEQQASSAALIKALKTELDHARARIKELLRDQRADCCEIDDLMKQIAEDKLVRKNQEQARINAAVQSAREELEDERKLRKRSESLHRKLVRELSDVKSSLSDALKDLERERRSRILLEELCDEFAKGITGYEQEVHALKQKSNKDWEESCSHDRLILHVSDSWLDERMQIKLEEARSGVAGHSSIAEKLGFEIESFLLAKHRDMSKSMDKLSSRNRRASLESVLLNEAVSAPRDCDSNFESHKDEVADHPTQGPVESNKAGSHEGVKSHSPSGLQVSFEEQMAWAMSRNGTRKAKQTVNAKEEITGEANPVEQREPNEDASIERKIKHNEVHGSSSNHLADNLIRSQLSRMEVGSARVTNDFGEASCSSSAWRTQASPVRQWDTKFTSPDLGKSESSSKVPPHLKENTLKEKLLEARSKGHRARMKASKVSSKILEG